MFRAEIDDIDLLQNSLQSIANVITEGVFQFTPDGLKLVAADPAMVAMVDFVMEDEAFGAYDCGEDAKIGINIEDLYNIVRRAGSNDSLILEMDEDGSKLQVTITNNSTRKFSLSLLNLDESDVPSTSDLEFAARADLKTSVLADAVGDASVVGDSVTFETDGGALLVRSEGDNSHTEFRIEQGSDGLMDFEDGEARSMFSLDYLNKIIKAKKLSDTVTLQMGDDFPMRIDFEIPEKVRLGFILAPRIEED